MKIKDTKGFVALVAIMIVSSTLLFVSVSLNVTVFAVRDTVLRREVKLQARNLAESCFEYALMRLMQDTSFTVTSPRQLTFSAGFCTVESVTTDGTIRIIEAKSVVKKSTFTIQGSVETSNRNNFFIISLSFF